jgi:hypothetical protein
MEKTNRILVAAMAGVLAWGCGPEMGEDADTGVVAESKDVSSVTQKLVVTGDEFSWSQGRSPTPMGSSADRLCFLTRVTGELKGGGESVHAYVSNGSWYLGGASQQIGVAASARCVPLRWNNRSYGYTGAFNWSQGNNSTYLGVDSNRTCFLTRVTGQFQGAGERVEVYRSGGGWWLGGTSQQAGVAASARCLTGSSPVGPYHWSQGQAARIMSSTSSYACGLTRMTGQFEGGGEYLRVYAVAGSWYLGGASQQAGVAGSAYCAY